MDRQRIGEADEWGYVLLDRRGPVELYETPKGYNVVYLYVNEDYLFSFRKRLNDARLIFDSVLKILKEGVYMADRLGWSTDELLNAYKRLIAVSYEFKETSKTLDQKSWVVFNQMRDRGEDIDRIANEIKIPLTIALSAEDTRRCIIKWDSDWGRVKDCIAGKIDP